MPKLVSRAPKYSRHKRSGQAFVRLNGRQVPLGPWSKSPKADSRVAYDRIVGEYLANGRILPRSEITVSELVASYAEHAESYYDGKTDVIKVACKTIRTLYGKTAAESFGPLALESLTQRLIDDGKSRSYIVALVRNIRLMFKWGVSKQLFPASVLHALQCVAGPRKGKTDAREAKPVEPVDDATVDATLPYLPSTLADMVRIHRLIGCRPTELCIMRPVDVDRSGDVWSYTPAFHKTEHHGHARKIFIGPKAQAILLAGGYLDRDATAYCFVPAEVVAKQNAERLKNPLLAKRRRTRKPKRSPGDRYTEDSYRRAVARACELMGRVPDELCKPSKEYAAALKIRRESGGKIPVPAELVAIDKVRRKEASEWRSRHTWHPNQLRHSAATEIRKRHGIEAASTVLGHTKVSTTELYAERNFELAARIAAER